MAQHDDFFAGYVEEVRGYIPILRQEIAELQLHPENRAALDEMHRLIHIIRGASAMMGFAGLSQVAGCMETGLERIQAGELMLNADAFSAMSRTVGIIEQYCASLSRGVQLDDARLLADTEEVCKKMRGNGVSGSSGPLLQALGGGMQVQEAPASNEMGPDAELLAEFSNEAEEHFAEVHLAMEYLHAQVQGPIALSGELHEAVRRVRRAVHTIKGASAVIGLQDIPDFAHLIEDALDWLYESAGVIDEQILGLAASLLDQLEALVTAPASYDHERAEAALLQMQAIIDQTPASQTAPLEDTFLQAPDEDLVTPTEELGAEAMSASLFSEEEQQMLREGFREEAHEHLEQLHLSLSALETQVMQSMRMEDGQREEVRRIRRAVHTIKGASAVIGLPEISTYAHKVEDFLDWLFENAVNIDPLTVNSLARSLDLLGVLIEAPQTVTAERKEEIYRILTQLSVEPPEAAAQSEPLGKHEIEAAAEEKNPEPEAIDPLEELLAQGDSSYSNPPLAEPSSLELPEQLARREETPASAPPQEASAPPELAPSTDARGQTEEPILSTQARDMLREGFFEEADTHLQELHQSLQAIEGRVSAETALDEAHLEEIDKMRRIVHSIKGASALIGLGEISAYARRVGDFLDWLQDQATHINPVLVNTLANALDVLELLVEAPEKVSWERLNLVCDQLSAAPKLSAAPLMEAAQAEDASVAPFSEPQSEALPFDSSLVATEPQPPTTPPSHVAETSPDAVSEQAAPTPIDSPATATSAQPPPVAASALVMPETAKTIRINQAQLDMLINLANELLVGVSGFDQNMGLFKTALEELDLTTRRLKDIALELETKFEVKALDQLSRHFERLDQTRIGIADAGFTEFDAMELDRYTQLNLIIRSLNESTIDVAAIHGNLGGIHSGLGGDINRQHRVVRELQVQMMRVRLSPMSTLTPRLSRTMRDVASKLNRRVRLVVEGEWVELDRVVWEKLADPFMHLVRNAVHHGIESPEERLALHKPAIATVKLSGHREGNHIVIRFADDGQGLDFEAIKKRGRQFGLGLKVEQMDEQQLTELIFYPGFSTKSVSQISGRGVGMDVVKQNVQELQGSIAVSSRKGQGTEFTIKVPLTLGVVRALLIKIGEVTYGVALNDIQDIHRVERLDISEHDGTLRHQESFIPWYSLSRLLGLSATPEEDEERRPLMLIIDVDGQAVGISIPRIAGQKEVVIKGLGAHLRSVAGISGAAVMGDGGIIPVLDIPELIKALQRDIEKTDILTFERDIPHVFTVMIVDDSISIRRVMSRLVVSNGWTSVEAKDGQDALEQLEFSNPDCIILDVEMPRMNGFEFLAKKANLADKKDIPVVMLTSRTSDKHRQKAIELGAAAFLNKPTKDEEFVETVLRLTGERAGMAGHSAEVM